MSASEQLAKLERRVPADAIDWEQVLEACYRTLLPAGCGVVDVGAHTGRHTRVFVERLHARHVVAVEPLPWLASALIDRFGHDRRIEVRQVALGVEPGTAEFVVNDGGLAQSGLRRRRYAEEEQARIRHITVEVERLDDWEIDTPLHYIKLDIEGGEIDALRGGAATLARHRPLVSVEYGQNSYEVYGHEPGTLWDLAEELDYRPADLFGNVYRDRDEWLACVDRYAWDYLLVPAERVQELRGQQKRVRRRALAVVARSATRWFAGRLARRL